MFRGEQTKVKMRFENSLLDAVIDKFGVGFGAEYQQDGDTHFIVKIEVEVSDQPSMRCRRRLAAKQNVIAV